MRPRARRGIGGVLVAAAVAACGLDAVGTQRAPEVQLLPDGGAAPSPDAGRDVATGPSCLPIAGPTPGSIIVPRVAIAPAVDGDLADWPACFVDLDASSAYLVRNLGGPPARGAFSLVHDGAKLYVAARVEGVAPLGGNGGPEIYRNDSVEVYLDADGMTESGYGADTMQIVVDHDGRIQGFHESAQVAAPGAAAAARADADGRTYTIEVAVAPSTFGAAAFATIVGFDIAINEGDGQNQLSQIVWFQKCTAATGCQCANGNDAPYCDSRQFGSATLAP